MGFKKYYVTEILTKPSPPDTYKVCKIEVNSVNSDGDESNDYLFSDEHNLEEIEIGYWYVC